MVETCRTARGDRLRSYSATGLRISVELPRTPQSRQREVALISHVRLYVICPFLAIREDSIWAPQGLY